MHSNRSLTVILKFSVSKKNKIKIAMAKTESPEHFINTIEAPQYSLNRSGVRQLDAGRYGGREQCTDYPLCHVNPQVNTYQNLVKRQYLTKIQTTLNNIRIQPGGELPRVPSFRLAVSKGKAAEITPKHLLPRTVNEGHRKFADTFYRLCQLNREQYKIKPEYQPYEYSYFKHYPPLYETQTMKPNAHPKSLDLRYPTVEPFTMERTFLKRMPVGAYRYVPRYSNTNETRFSQ